MIKSNSISALGIQNTFAEIELLLTDGTRVNARHDAGIPAVDVTDQGRRLEEKFTALVEPVFGSQRNKALISLIGGLESLENLTELMALTGG